MSRIALPTVLLADAIFEFVTGAALVIFAGALGNWLSIGSTACIVLGVIFIVAGIALLALRGAPDTRAIQALAAANIAGGTIGWIIFLALWGQFEPEGRTVLGTASDAFIAIGVLEIIALRASSRRELA